MYPAECVPVFSLLGSERPLHFSSLTPLNCIERGLNSFVASGHEGEKGEKLKLLFFSNMQRSKDGWIGNVYFQSWLWGLSMFIYSGVITSVA